MYGDENKQVMLTVHLVLEKTFKEVQLWRRPTFYGITHIFFKGELPTAVRYILLNRMLAGDVVQHAQLMSTNFFQMHDNPPPHIAPVFIKC